MFSLTAFAIGALAIWLLLSAANQIPGPWQRRLAGVAPLGLLPGLAFFAPDPIDVDYHLLIRDVFENGKAEPWRPVPTDRDGLLRVIWSTAKRDHQATVAAVAGLATLQQQVAPFVSDPERLLLLSMPYLFLLQRALQAPRRPGASRRQFVIVEVAGFERPRRIELGVLSLEHRFEAA